jgi:hypothetical protein
VPEELNTFFRFIQTNVLEYTNERLPLTTADYLKVGAFLASRGLSAQTVKTVFSSWPPKRDGHNRWRRAVILDRLQFDVFRSYYRKLEPTFSTFFLNSTAHYQHSYWRNMNPEPFQIKPTAAEQAEYAPAVLFGYQEMDHDHWSVHGARRRRDHNRPLHGSQSAAVFEIRGSWRGAVLQAKKFRSVGCIRGRLGTTPRGSRHDASVHFGI